MYFEVKEAQYKSAYTIDLRFEDGSTGAVDLQKYIGKDNVFKELQDESNFKDFEIEYGTLVWKKYDLDIAPETLYLEATGKEMKPRRENRLVS
jgi:Protein of unknown function (DUF2442)